MNESSKISAATGKLLVLFIFLFSGLSAAIAQDAMFVDSSGDVGIGTNSPGAAVHLVRNADAELWVENTSTTASERVPFRLINRGKTRFVINNIDAGEIWTFDNTGVSFDISRVGTGVGEFRVLNNGDVRMDQGEAFAQAFNTVSSRSAKTDFTPVDAETILNKLATLDVSEWRYRDAPGSERHIGPVAEDFQATFGLGTDKHISLVDFAGVSFSAIKALKAENEALRSELASLRADLEKLKKRRQ